MKMIARILALSFVILFTSFAFAENSKTIDLSSMSYDELISLKDSINLAMWKTAEWQEVTVWEGTWKVGEDIPAGHWTVKCAPGVRLAQINWGEELQENGEDIKLRGKYSFGNVIRNPEIDDYSDPDKYMHTYSFEVIDGDYIMIDGGSVIFMPYIGKPSFSFK